MRRSDRQISELPDILEILDKCDVIRIGLCYADKPYVVPVNFAYQVADGDMSIYFHCANEGKKLDIIAKNNNVCFEADCSYKILKGEMACDWSAGYESVIGEGKISVLTKKEQKTAGLDLLMKRYGFEGKPQYSEKSLTAVTLVKISVQSITGKSNLHD